MRVLFLHQQPCMRALKYAAGFRSVGVQLELGFAYRGMTLTELYGAGDELFDRWWRIGPDLEADLRRVLAEFEPQLIHSHNLPDALTVLALAVTGGRVPVIHDVHDMHSLRSTPYEDGFPESGEDATALERAAVEGAAGLLTVSAELLAELATRYELPERTGVYANYALARDLQAELPPPERPLGAPPRIVYQGSLSQSGGHYDLRDIFRRICAAGATLDVFPARENAEYRRLAAVTPGLRVHANLCPADLMRELSRFDFGWAGFNDALNAPHLDTVLPNKLFEYAAAGLPVLTFRHRALADFVDAEGIGLVLDDVDGLPARLRALDLPALRRRVAQARHGYTVEANLSTVLDVYSGVVADWRARDAEPVPERAA